MLPPAAARCGWGGGCPMLGDLLFPRAAVPALVGWVGWRRLIGFFQCPCLGQDHMAGDTRCLFPPFPDWGELMDASSACCIY